MGKYSKIAPRFGEFLRKFCEKFAVLVKFWTGICKWILFGSFLDKNWDVTSHFRRFFFKKMGKVQFLETFWTSIWKWIHFGDFLVEYWEIAQRFGDFTRFGEIFWNCSPFRRLFGQIFWTRLAFWTFGVNFGNNFYFTDFFLQKCWKRSAFRKLFEQAFRYEIFQKIRKVNEMIIFFNGICLIVQG